MFLVLLALTKSYVADDTICDDAINEKCFKNTSFFLSNSVARGGGWNFWLNIKQLLSNHPGLRLIKFMQLSPTKQNSLFLKKYTARINIILH